MPPNPFACMGFSSAQFRRAKASSGSVRRTREKASRLPTRVPVPVTSAAASVSSHKVTQKRRRSDEAALPETDTSEQPQAAVEEVEEGDQQGESKAAPNDPADRQWLADCVLEVYPGNKVLMQWTDETGRNRRTIEDRSCNPAMIRTFEDKRRQYKAYFTKTQGSTSSAVGPISAPKKARHDTNTYDDVTFRDSKMKVNAHLVYALVTAENGKERDCDADTTMLYLDAEHMHTTKMLQIEELPDISKYIANNTVCAEMRATVQREKFRNVHLNNGDIQDYARELVGRKKLTFNMIHLDFMGSALGNQSKQLEPLELIKYLFEHHAFKHDSHLTLTHSYRGELVVHKHETSTWVQTQVCRRAMENGCVAIPEIVYPYKSVVFLLFRILHSSV
jgi:hypothetical protein